MHRWDDEALVEGRERGQLVDGLGFLSGRICCRQSLVHRLFGDVAIATLSGEQALIAQGRLRELASTAGVDLSDAEASRAWFASDSEAGFYSRKCDNFRFFAHQFLPRTAAALAAIKSSDRSALDSVF